MTALDIFSNMLILGNLLIVRRQDVFSVRFVRWLYVPLVEGSTSLFDDIRTCISPLLESALGNLWHPIRQSYQRQHSHEKGTHGTDHDGPAKEEGRGAKDCCDEVQNSELRQNTYTSPSTVKLNVSFLAPSLWPLLYEVSDKSKWARTSW
jgi:hypothetical protein